MTACSYKCSEGKRLALSTSPWGIVLIPKILNLLLVKCQLAGDDVKDWSKTHGEVFM